MLFSKQFSFSEEDQSKGRVFRLSQQYPVFEFITLARSNKENAKFGFQVEFQPSLKSAKKRKKANSKCY